MGDDFDCHSCKDSLLGKKYILRESNQYCTKCYDNLYSNTCEDCKKLIGSDCKDLSYKDLHWHEQCFKCAKCGHSLAEKPFSTKEDSLLCMECYSDEYSSKCFTCKKTIMPGSRKVEYKGNIWHEACFVCERCRQSIGTRTFITKENNSYCVSCYEKQFAHSCSSCKKPIMTGGVSYHDRPWHRKCLLCTGCKMQLAGNRFTSRDDFPYCLDCFTKLYTKKCVACSQAIAGLGTSKYISFENCQCHNNCSKCKNCASSLVCSGFLSKHGEVVCPACGRDI
ncbi:four and a half LIM domains protein 2-like [Mobula hypostoma]|uniref:four and a half LIM domains protein 2-like n=1 Tax=Mobula hypostoma TaxID=723540 RepID=UPI002FC3BBFD